MIFIAVVGLFACHAFAQRSYSINDSTSYQLGNTKITVGRHKVYHNVNEELTLIRDFTLADEPLYYVRDFDFIDADSWYVLVGSRYIGAPTQLYRTDDSGVSWELVVPFLPGLSGGIDDTANSINQVQVLDNRIYLFDNYYQSRVVYSDDGGQSWVLWFESFWSHWYQIYACGNDLYIHGMPGDGFRAYMTQIPASYFGGQNIQTVVPIGGCHNGNTEGCYYAPANITVPEIYNHFKSVFETVICPNLGIEEAYFNSIQLVPNPAQNNLSIQGLDPSSAFQITLYNSLGQQMISISNRTEIDLANLSAGVYQLRIEQHQRTLFRKMLKL